MAEFVDAHKSLKNFFADGNKGTFEETWEHFLQVVAFAVLEERPPKRSETYFKVGHDFLSQARSTEKSVESYLAKFTGWNDIAYQHGLAFLKSVQEQKNTLIRELEPTEKPRSGRPKYDWMMNLAIFYVLEKNKGNRTVINKVGEFIQREGKLEIFVNHAFGLDSYGSLKTPKVSIIEGNRWETSFKNKMRQKMIAKENSIGSFKGRKLDALVMRKIESIFGDWCSVDWKIDSGQDYRNF